jgi:hypothetical protein
MSRGEHFVTGDDMDKLNKESRIRKEKLRRKAAKRAIDRLDPKAELAECEILTEWYNNTGVGGYG